MKLYVCDGSTNIHSHTVKVFTLFLDILNCWLHEITRTTISLSASILFSKFRTIDKFISIHLHASIECIAKTFHIFYYFIFYHLIEFMSFNFFFGIDNSVLFYLIIILKLDISDAKVVFFHSSYTVPLSFKFLRASIATWVRALVHQSSFSKHWILTIFIVPRQLKPMCSTY